MKYLDKENKEWLCNSLEWMIDLLGYEDFYRRPFFESTDVSLQAFHDNEVFSLDDFCSYLCQLLELRETFSLVVIGGEEIKKEGNIIFIDNPIDGNRDVLIKIVTEELLTEKAKELGLSWVDSYDDAVIIALLSGFYGVTTLLIRDEVLTVKKHIVHEELVEYFLAAIFSVKSPELICFVDLFGKKVREHIESIQQDDDSIHEFQQLIPQFKRSDKVIQDLKHADQMYQDGYYSLAISILKELSSQYPQRITLWNTLGYYQQRNKQYHDSIISFDAALSIDKFFIYALTNKGLSLLLLHKIKESKYYFDEAEKLDSSDPLVLRNKGIYFSAINKIHEAKLCFKKVISLNSFTELVHFYYAIVLLQNNEQIKAIENFKISAANGEIEANEKLIKLDD